jgi:pyruvate formate lyase activating enzyme
VSFAADSKAVIDRNKCEGCLICAEGCPSRALRAEGRSAAVSDILDAAERDSVFYSKGGGLTVSGGEPLMQGDFLIELLREAKRLKINTAMETCGFGAYEVLRAAAELLDMIFYDIKSEDAEKHERWTGRGNALILENFSRLCADFPELPKTVRTPVISGFNEGETEEIRAFALRHPNTDYEPLPYHRFGVGKYAALGREYAMT